MIVKVCTLILCRSDKEMVNLSKIKVVMCEDTMIFLVVSKLYSKFKAENIMKITVFKILVSYSSYYTTESLVNIFYCFWRLFMSTNILTLSHLNITVSIKLTCWKQAKLMACVTCPKREGTFLTPLPLEE